MYIVIRYKDFSLFPFCVKRLGRLESHCNNKDVVMVMLHVLIGLGYQGHNYNICYPFAIAQSALKEEINVTIY